jgi:hypothetical protein
MKKTRFKITDFLNPSGKRVYRVSGTLDGKTIRKNFQSRSDAVEYRQKLEIEFLNGESTGQTVWTTLTHDQNRDAITAVNLLKRAGSDRSLSFAVDFFLRHYRSAREHVTLEDAAKAYVDEKKAECSRGLISGPQWVKIDKELRRLVRMFPDKLLADLGPEDLRAFLSDRGDGASSAPSLKTWNNRRGYLSTFYKYCLAEKLASVNPVLDVPQYRIKKSRGTAETLDAASAERFMHWLESYRGKGKKNGSWWGEAGCLVPYFALALFAGVRPDWRDGEMAKLRPEHIRMDTGVILIEPDVSKVNEKRSIKIQPNLRMWLERYPLSMYPIIPARRFRLLLLDVRREWTLAHDVMRHTFISMTVGAFRSVGDAALQAGNSEAIIRRHYLDLKSVEEADRFWRIVPEGMALPEKMEKRDGRYGVVDG